MKQEDNIDYYTYCLQSRYNDCILPRIGVFVSIYYSIFHTTIYFTKQHSSLIPVAARSKAWVCGRSLTGIAGSKPTWGKDVLSVVSVVCCQLEVSAAERSLVQRTAECDVFVSDLETSTMM